MEKELNLTKLQNEINETNPFILQLGGKMFIQPRANTIVAQGEAIVSTETGEVLLNKGVLLGRRKWVDKSEFAKLYFSELNEILNLSKKALNLLVYLSKTMDFDNKTIFLPTKDFKKLGYKSENTSINALKELIKNNIIAVGRIYGEWWINPIYFCKGERFVKYTEFIYDKSLDREKEAIEEVVDQINKEKNMLPAEVQEKINLANKPKSKYNQIDLFNENEKPL